MWWLMFASALALLTLIGALLSRRFGRGAYETTFKRPENEVQGTTTPWKGWP